MEKNSTKWLTFMIDRFQQLVGACMGKGAREFRLEIVMLSIQN